MPYPIKVGDKMLIMIPHQYTINDHRMQEEGTRHDFFEKFKDEFDYRYRIGDRKSDHDERHHARLYELAGPLHRHVRKNHRVRQGSQRRLVRPARRYRRLGEKVLRIAITELGKSETTESSEP